MSLPGVGRKSANVILSQAFGQDALAVDTHVFRVSHWLSLAGKTWPQSGIAAGYSPSPNGPRPISGSSGTAASVPGPEAPLR